MANVKTALTNFFATNAANVKAIEALRSACESEKIKTPEKLRPLALEMVAKHYGIELVEMTTGKHAGTKGLDTSHKSHEAAKKAMNRAIAKVFPSSASGDNNTDPVPGIIKKIEALDGRVLRRLVSTLKAKGLI